MFNRFLYQKLVTQNYERQVNERIQNKLREKRKFTLQQSSEKYKSKVRNFLVQLASSPIKLGSYQPPVKIIMRQSPNSTLNRLGRSQMIINGFETVEKRTQVFFQSQKKDNEIKNKMFDYSPTKLQWGKQSFRQRNKNGQIHPKQMSFGKTQSKILNKNDSNELQKTRSQSLKSLKLPSLMNKDQQKKTYFKAIEELANSISTMNQSKNDRTGLQNRLMVVMDGKQVKIESTALELLAKSNFIKKRANSQRTLKTFQSMQI